MKVCIAYLPAHAGTMGSGGMPHQEIFEKTDAKIQPFPHTNAYNLYTIRYSSAAFVNEKV